jgi:hypothetical protein
MQLEGDRLASVSSRHSDDQTRWTEMTLYKTDKGSYVLEKVGRSVVTHVPGCSEILGNIPRFQDAHPGDDPDVGYAYHLCVPAEYDFTALLVEEDRYWAVISTEPGEIVEALYRKQGEARFMPRISITLIEEASIHDELLASSWNYTRII